MTRKKKKGKKTSCNLKLMLMSLNMAILVGNGNFCPGFLSIDGVELTTWRMQNLVHA